MNSLKKSLADFIEKYKKDGKHIMRIESKDKLIFGYVDEETVFKDLEESFENYDITFNVRILETEVPEYLKYGTVIVPTCDMRKFPTFESERVHQLIFNEKVKVLQIQTDYYLVKDLKSSYIGYVRSPQLSFDSEVCDNFNYAVISKFTDLIFKDFRMTLPFGTRLKVTGEIEGFYFVETKLGTGKLKKDDLISLNDISTRDFVELMNLYISTPYLWGGTSTLGTDCSGFVYRLYDSMGVNVPRDTNQQLDNLKPISREELQIGDLILFKGHVGLYYGNGKMIHSSATLGGVHISNIFDPQDLYEEKLKKSIVGFRKIETGGDEK